MKIPMNVPNILTFFRFCLIPVYIVAFITGETKEIAAWIFITASATDVLDGYIARKYNMISNFGKFMDPLADKLLVCSALICLLALGRINVFLVLIIIARDFIISGFRLVASDKGVVIAANMWGKVKTTMQMVMIGFMIPDLAVFHWICVILSWVVLFLTVYSLMDYLIRNRSVLKDEK